jgi:chromosome segregation ATPase
MAPRKGREGMIHEKIQWFKDFYQLDREILPSETGISYNDLLLLINTIEQQQKEVEYWKKIVVNDREAFRKQRRKMQQQLQQAQAKIERLEEWDAIRRDRIVQLEDQLEQLQDKVKQYEKALKEIAYDSFNDSKEDCQQIAKETLEGDTQ